REPGSLRAQEEGRKCPLGKKNSQPGRASEISTLNFCVKLPARKKLDIVAGSIAQARLFDHSYCEVKFLT
ncbi:MAG: hypothetical protein ACK5W9_00870, partial [Bdellovibrionales bacterium]